MRLTKRDRRLYALDNNGTEHWVDFINISHRNRDDADEKLCQLEDIEEELGIDLITLFKALKNGFYYKHYLKGDIVFDDGTYNRISLYDNGINIDLDEGWFYFMYKDYGKTWALTKEELK